MVPYKYQYVPVTGAMDDKQYRQLFATQYYSGCEAHIYMNNQLMAECNNLQCELNEKTLPIFAYNSYTAQGWAKGNRIVQGMFSVNMVGMNYLEELVNSQLPQRSLPSSRLNSEVVEYSENNKQNDPSVSNAYKKLYWSVNRNYGDKRLQGRERNDYRMNSASISRDLRNIPFFSKAPFNIYIVYRMDEIPLNYNARYHLQSIDDVHLTNMTIAFDISGKPIQQIYNFLAGDWNRTHRTLS